MQILSRYLYRDQRVGHRHDSRLKALNEKAEREEWEGGLPKVTDIFSNFRNRTCTMGLLAFLPIQILVLHNLAQSGLGHEPLGSHGWEVAAKMIGEGEDMLVSGSKLVWLVGRWIQNTEREAVRDGRIPGPWLLRSHAIIWALDETHS